MNKRMKLVFCFLAMLSIVTWMMPQKTYAYFNRGTVGISAGKSSVTLNPGESVSISVNLSPSAQAQLPGCGMAECPQICGEKDCLDANGECTCSGTVPNTYVTSVSCSSSNASVASASFGSGMVTIYGNQAGTATITLVASLRQYSDGATSITVTVNAPPAPQPEPSTPPAAPAPQTSSSGTGTSTSAQTNNTSSQSDSTQTVRPDDPAGENQAALGTQESGNTTAGDAQDAAEEGAEELKVADGEKVETEGILEDAAERIVKTKTEGTILFVDLDKVQNQTGTYFKQAKERGYTLVFQKMEGENVFYSWKFLGKDLENTDDRNLKMIVDESSSEGVMNQIKGKEALFLSFSEEGEIPADAVVNLRVSSYFDDGTPLYLYHVKEDGTLELVEKEISVTNGYAEFKLSYCADYVLMDGMLEEQTNGGTNLPYILLGMGGAAAVCAVGVFLYRKKLGKIEHEKQEAEGPETEKQEGDIS